MFAYVTVLMISNYTRQTVISAISV